MRLLRMMAVVAVAALVGVGTASTALASESVETTDKIHVENLTVLVDQWGGAAIDGLVVCDFASNPNDPDITEVSSASLTQRGVTAYSIGDFIYCGGRLDISPLGGIADIGYFKPGKVLLHLAFGLCDAEFEATVCGRYSFDGYVTFRKV